MLSKEDMELLRSMMREEINTAVTASESRTKTEIMAYIESHVEIEIRAIADGHLMLAEKMDRMQANMETMQADIDEIKATVTAHDIIITSRYRQAK